MTLFQVSSHALRSSSPLLLLTSLFHGKSEPGPWMLCRL